MCKSKNIRASVAMAVYNGQRYVKEQIDSIVELMSDEDELIISYNKSDDHTLDIIKEYESNDSRIKIVFDNGNTVESNFNNAVKYCSGKYIFLADQDDVWFNDKLNKMVHYFEEHKECGILICNGYVTDKNLNRKKDIFHQFHTTNSAVRNFFKGSYLGCQMAFTRKIKDIVWPVCVNPPIAHDLWLGVYGAIYCKVQMIDEPMILHRIHENNYSHTSRMSLIGKIKDRIHFLKQLTIRYYQTKTFYKLMRSE